MNRTSRLEAYTDQILASISAGKTYAAIAGDLTRAGCTTSAPNLHKWLARRAARIRARAALVNPMLAVAAMPVRQVEVVERPQITAPVTQVQQTPDTPALNSGQTAQVRARKSAPTAPAAVPAASAEPGKAAIAGLNALAEQAATKKKLL